MASKILIVEDNPDFRTLIALLLQEQGYTVATAEDGQQGLKQTLADCPDLIITDINMPNLNGIEMVRMLRDLPECRGIPVVVISALGSGDLTGALEAGANQGMRKPLDLDRLIQAIKRLLPAAVLGLQCAETILNLISAA
jgi:two-component system chemotaxis response regulator CheY